LGAAYALGLARRHPPQGRALPADGIAVCSFGDASLNHSTAQGAINAAGWTVAQSAPLPLLLICEDNGIGISVPTPKGWVAASMRARPGIRYFAADGCDLYATYAAARDAAEFVRRQRKPAFLHLSTVRLYGHAGADIASSYLPLSAIEADEARDPLLHSVRLLQAAGAMTPDAAREVYHAAEVEARAAADRAASRPHLETAAAVMRSIVPPQRPASPARTPVPKPAPPVAEPLGRHLTRTLHDTLDQYPEVILMGEDIGRKGGVYGITQKLQATFGRDRVMDTLLDEQSILGLAIGLAHNGFIPVPEIQFLAYLHNAEDQLRGEAATLPFFSNGQFANPMVVRIAGLGYQKGFGGHFHNDNALAVLRDIPGLILACPSTGDTAALMLRECVRLAREENRVSVFLEPIALYAERDLHTPGDGAWARPPAGPGSAIGFGDIGVTGDGTDLAIITYGNGHYLSQKAAPALTRAGIGWRIIDLRWLAPLPETALLGAVEQCRSVLVVDECRRSGGVAEGVMALLAERTPLPLARETATDSFIATGPAYAATLPSADSIAVAAKDLLARLS
ncbi:MAG: thiamine pyrophosphate-dependent enzyme, partial [Pseudomonadota bacterium]